MSSKSIKLCVCLLITIAVVRCDDGVDLDSNNLNSKNKNAAQLIPNLKLTGPESRQISVSADPSTRASSVYPYNIPLYAANLPQQSQSSPTSSSSGSSGTGGGGGWFSMFRPGRRSSLTSRLRNLVNSLFFRRETSSPYLGSGSSYSLSYRPPPLGYGSNIPNSNYMSSASNRYPVVFGNYPSSSVSSPTWSNYKQWATGNSPFASQLNSGGAGNYAWTSSLGNNRNSYMNLGSNLGYSNNGLSSSGGSSPSSSLTSNNGYGGSTYQVAASNVYPSAVYVPPHRNQRSSLNYKPSSYSSSSPSQASSSDSSSSGSSHLYSGDSKQSVSLGHLLSHTLTNTQPHT